MHVKNWRIIHLQLTVFQSFYKNEMQYFQRHKTSFADSSS